VIHACQAACASRSVSSPRPPTGLADGFGLEKPYGGPVWAIHGVAGPPIHPGDLCGSPAPRSPGRRSGTRRVAGPPIGGLQRVSAMDINGERHCRGPKQGRFSRRAPTRARPHCRPRPWPVSCVHRPRTPCVVPIARYRRRPHGVSPVASWWGPVGKVPGRRCGQLALRPAGSAVQALRGRSHLAVVAVFGILTSWATQLP
jgi:hypothetical protein